MRISDWSSDVCSSDLAGAGVADFQRLHHVGTKTGDVAMAADDGDAGARRDDARTGDDPVIGGTAKGEDRLRVGPEVADGGEAGLGRQKRVPGAHQGRPFGRVHRSEEHTSELQSLMRISYAVFCLKKKNNNKHNRATRPE